MAEEGKTPREPLEVACEDLNVRPAASREELEEAYQLVYTSYRQRGYLERDPSELRLSVFNAFPTTVTFVAVLRGEEIVATVSLVPDTSIGLPLDEIYHEEAQRLRDAGRRLAEVTMLADRRLEIRRSLPMLLLLMKRVFDYATLILNANDLCITINPRHETYYERYLLFKHLGGLKTYPSVRSNPALAKRLNLDTVRSECEGNEKLVNEFFRERTPLDVMLGAYRMTPEDIHHFLVERTSVLRRAPEEAVECLRRFYPDCPWDQWRNATT
jgi:hypothetical protein